MKKEKISQNHFFTSNKSEKTSSTLVKSPKSTGFIFYALKFLRFIKEYKTIIIFWIFCSFVHILICLRGWKL